MAAEIHIADGTTVNATWDKMIAVSRDGVNWTTIYKDGLSVHPTQTGSGATNPPNVLGNNAIENRIYLKDSFGSQKLAFNCAHVVNQAIWNARTPAALRQAVDDLSTWISI